MAHKIDTPEARRQLRKTPRRDPYWAKLGVNQHLGWRCMTKDSAGTWVARLQEGRKSRTETAQLAHVAQLPEKLQYEEAKKLAQAWFDECKTQAAKAGAVSVIPERMTLRSVLSLYLQHIQKQDGQAKHDDIDATFSRLVIAYKGKDGKPWIDRPVISIKRAELLDWTQHLRERQSEARGAKPGDRLAPTTVNRYVKALRAALNWAHDVHHLPKVWQGALKTDNEAERKGARGAEADMSVEHRRALVEGASEVFVPFLRAIMMIPARPGCFAHALVEDYDRKHHTLFIRKDKHKRHTGRTIPLPEATRALFAAALKDGKVAKLPTAHLFTNTLGNPWNNNTWGDQIKSAAENAGLPPDTIIYWLRHSRISDMLADNELPPIDIAKIAGTSLAMIQQHYHHMRDAPVRAAMARLPGF